MFLVQKMEAPGEQFAIKVVQSENQTMMNLNANLSKCKKHANIARVYSYGKRGFIKKPKGWTSKNDLSYVRMQLLQGGTLRRLIESVGGKLSEEEARFFFV